jgi:hypothetical protein
MSLSPILLFVHISLALTYVVVLGLIFDMVVKPFS